MQFLWAPPLPQPPNPQAVLLLKRPSICRTGDMQHRCDATLAGGFVASSLLCSHSGAACRLTLLPSHHHQCLRRWFFTAGTESAEELLQRATSSTPSSSGNGNGNGNGSAPLRFDGRAFRRALNKTGRYVRQPVDDAESLALMEEHGVGYSSTGLIARMRHNGNVWQEKVRLGSSPQHPLCSHQDPQDRHAWEVPVLQIQSLSTQAILSTPYDDKYSTHA